MIKSKFVFLPVSFPPESIYYIKVEHLRPQKQPPKTERRPVNTVPFKGKMRQILASEDWIQ